MTDLAQADLDAIAAFDTPTVCNALELIVPERRGHGFTVEHLHPLDPDLPPFVGYARTATMRAMFPSGEAADASAKTRADYYRYVAQSPQPAIIIIQDLDPVPGTGAFWGEVNTHIHRGLGLKGCITNGSFRDIPDSAKGFQILGGKVGPSHAHVHIVDFGGKVNVVGLIARHDDIIHADRHGAVMVPRDAVKKIPDVVALLQRREAVILDAAKAPGFDIDKLIAAMGSSKEIH